MARGVCISVLTIETVDFRSQGIYDGGSYPLTIEELKEGMYIDVHRSVHLIPGGKPFAPKAADRKDYEQGLETISMVTRVLGEVASLPTVAYIAKIKENDGSTTEQPVLTSLLITPRHVEPVEKEDLSKDLNPRPTWALPIGDRKISHKAGGKNFLYIVRQEVFAWDGKL